MMCIDSVPAASTVTTTPDPHSSIATDTLEKHAEETSTHGNSLCHYGSGVRKVQFSQEYFNSLSSHCSTGGQGALTQLTDCNVHTQ